MKLAFFTDYINGLNPTFNTSGVHGDFIHNAYVILDTIGLPHYVAQSVAESLYQRMSDPRLRYHTPVHVLRMLQTISYEKFDLSTEEYLAILFHDAVYDPAAPPMQNETASAMLMTSMAYGYAKKELIKKAAIIIRATGMHQKKEVPKFCEAVMDLDMYRFGMNLQVFNEMGEWLAAEFLPIYGEKAFHEGSISFLRKLVRKGFVFRTVHFYNRYEPSAISNVQCAIRSHERWLNFNQ